MKSYRILDLYNKIINEEKIDIEKLALEENKTKRTIERDIAEIKEYLTLKKGIENFEYDRKNKKYTMNKTSIDSLTKSEALAIVKILMDSRAFLKEEMNSLVDKILKNCTSNKDYKELESMVKNEKFHYTELKNKKSFIQDLYNYGCAVKKGKKIKIKYRKTSGEVVKRIIYPVGLMFSEFYFYLLAHIENVDKSKFENKDDKFPTIYRIDRIEKFEILKENFSNIYYSNRFEEGKFRKQIYFMTGGKLRKVQFIYRGSSLESVLDKIPTARVRNKTVVGSKEEYLIMAEVFGNGFDKWVRSQGDDVLITVDHT